MNNKLFSIESIQHNSNIYERYKDMLNTISPDTIRQICEIVTKEFEKLPCKVKFVNNEFNDFGYIKQKYLDEGVLYISALHNNSDIFPGSFNLYFRAWHDWIHIQYDLTFDYKGEYQTYLHHIKGIEDETIRKIFYSEIVLQTAYYTTHGVFPQKQKVILIEPEN